MNELFNQLDFVEDPLYERIITDLLQQHYSVIDYFFSEEEVSLLRDELCQKYQEDAFKKSAIGSRFDEQIEKSIRGDFVCWMQESCASSTEQLFFDKIHHMVDYLNKTCFMGIVQQEFHYAVYPKGTFYKRHLDVFQNDQRRKLSVVCYLNEDSWKSSNGGALVIYTDDGEVVLDPLPGRMVLFESQLLEHEVREVLAGERYSITGWLKTH